MPIKHTLILFFFVFKLIPSVAIADSGDLTLNGKGIYSQFQADYYLAQLFVNKPSNNADTLYASTAIEMHTTILTDSWSKRRFLQHWNQAVFINNSAEQRDLFASFMSDWAESIQGELKKGDEIKFTKTEKHFIFSINDVQLMKSEQRDGINLLLNTWIGSKPPSSDFKSGILGETSLTDSHYESLARVDSYEQRKKEIKSWIAPPVESKPVESKKAVALENKATNKVVTDSVVATNIAKKEIAKKQAEATSVAVATATPKEAPKAAPKEAIPPVKESLTSKPVVKNETSSATLADSPSVAADTSDSAPAPAENTVTELAEASKDVNIDANVDNDVTPAPENSPEENTQPAIAAKQTTADSKKEVDANVAEPAEDPLLRIYRSNVMTLTYQNLIYPMSAINREQEGKVLITVTVNRKGKVIDFAFDKKSKYRSLNKAVEKAVTTANPFPAVPKKLRGDEVKLSMPIVFKLSG